jgi:hypothetical protein
MCQVETALFGKLSRTIATKTEEMEQRFKEIVQGCQLYGIDIWNIIGSLRNDQEGKSNAGAERVNRLNEDVTFLKTGADYWKQPLS